MIVINIKNIEKKIFEEEKVWKKLNDLKHLRDQWQLGKITPALKHMGKRAVLDLLNNLKEKHIEILSEFFNDEIIIEKFDYHSIKNLNFSNTQKIDEELNLMENKNELYSYFSTYKDKDNFYITFWR